MLQGGLKESQSKVVTLTSPPAKQFKEVLRYCYVGKIEVTGWKMEELLALLSLAHEYQFDDLVTHVVIALEEQPLDFGQWDMMHATATTLDLDILKSKCKASAENKVDSFLEMDNMQLFSTSLVNALLEKRKAATVNQTNLLKAISQWKSDKTAAEIRSALSKLDWEKVSPKVMAGIMKEVIQEVDLSGLKFWSDVYQGDYQGAACSCQKAAHLDRSPFIFSMGFHDEEEFFGQVLLECTTNSEMPEGSNMVFSKDMIKLNSGKEQLFLCRYSAGEIRWILEESNVTLGFVDGKCQMTGFKWDFHNVQKLWTVEGSGALAAM